MNSFVSKRLIWTRTALSIGAVTIALALAVAPMVEAQSGDQDTDEAADSPFRNDDDGGLDSFLEEDKEEDRDASEEGSETQNEESVDFFDTLNFLDEGNDQTQEGREGGTQGGLAEESDKPYQNDSSADPLYGDGAVNVEDVSTPSPDPLTGIDIEGLPGLPARSNQIDEDRQSWDIAVFRGLDKVTARVWLFEAIIDKPVIFGRFEVLVRQCNKRPPEETPNTTAFVEVEELTRSEEKNDVFKGWMFASSPGLNAVEHPVYDVWLIDCKMSEPSKVAGIEENVDEIVDGEVIDE
jgi:hypothetical protein